MDDELRFQHRAIDHPTSVRCPHCGADVALPRTEPWMVIGGAEIAPELDSIRCNTCRGRIYFLEVDEARRADDAAFDALLDEESDEDGRG